LILTVTNTSEKLLALRFNSSQNYDFVVTDAAGLEVWRWSRQMFFGQVIRSDSIRAKGNRVFEEVWNHRDGNANRVPPGEYRVVGILSSVSPVQSEPVTITIK
jgi:hypothetical protein